MASIIYSQGTVQTTVPASEKIAIFSLSSLSLYQLVGYPNHPSTWDLITTTDPGETYTSAAFTNETIVKVEATAATGLYEVGSAPVVGEPSFDITFAATPGVISGLAAAQGGSAQLKGGTSSTSGNAGGAAIVTGGQPGATGVGGAATVTGGAGGGTSGKGGAATVTGGAGTAGNGAGGSVIIKGGAPHSSGLDGGTFDRSVYRLKRQAAPSTAADTATLTVAQMLSGIIAATPTAAAAYTMPTGTLLKAAVPTDISAEDSFDVTIINLGGSGDDITLTASTDITIVGNPVVTVAVPSQGTFRLRFVTGVTWVAYRIG